MSEKQQRRCVACRLNRNQNEMLRVSKLGDGIFIDKTGKAGGRGAYVCMNNDCIERTIKKRLFNYAFKTNLNIEIYEKLRDYEQNN